MAGTDATGTHVLYAGHLRRRMLSYRPTVENFGAVFGKTCAFLNKNHLEYRVPNIGPRCH